MTNDQIETLTEIRLEVGKLASAVSSQTENRKQMIEDIGTIRREVSQVKQIIVGDGQVTGLSEVVRAHTAEINELKKQAKDTEENIGKAKNLGWALKGAIIAGTAGGGFSLWQFLASIFGSGSHPK